MPLLNIVESFPNILFHAPKRENLSCFLNETVNIRTGFNNDIDVRA